MIWFDCKKCKKVMGRPENSIGAMIFCDCGQSMTVPWESTAPEPDEIPVTEAQGVYPTLEPLQFETWRTNAPVSPSEASPSPPRRLNVSLPAPLVPQTNSRRGPRTIDPSTCFNHEGMPRKATCLDCNLNFCDECVCSFQGVTVCGPCKNYRTKLLQRPARAGLLSLTCVLTACLGAAALFLLFPMSIRWGSVVLTSMALIPQAIAFGLGMIVLMKKVSRRQALDGSLAIAGMATATVLSVVILMLALQGTKLI